MFLALALIGSRRGAPRRVIVSSVALVIVGMGLIALITHPPWWTRFPRLLQTVQMPMRLLPYWAIVTALAVAVLLVGLGQRRARKPLVAVLAVAVVLHRR